MTTSRAGQKIGSISNFLQQLEKIAEDVRARSATDGIRTVLYYRGQPEVGKKPIPKIYRNVGWIREECTVLNDLILRCPNDFASSVSTFQTLVKMQHYGLPTRLLDITSNPLAALYFACKTDPKNDKDGDVFVFAFDNSKVKYFDSDTVSVISNLSRRQADFKVPMVKGATAKELIKAFNETDEIKLLLHDVRQDKPHFEPIIQRAHLGEVICVKPMMDNPRVIRQDGAFLLFGINEEKVKPAEIEKKCIVHKFKIRQDKKLEISLQLEKLGISSATLFPEIENVAKYISQIYAITDLRSVGLKGKQKRVFALFFGGNKLNVSDVAKAVGVDKSNASLIISELYGLKLIERIGSGRGVGWQIRADVKSQLK